MSARTVTAALIIYADGREKCLMKTVLGRELYRARTLEMRTRQGNRCCLEFYAPMCPGPLRVAEATFEHETPKSGGRRDDRIILPDGTWINGAAHAACNVWKGSRHLPYNQEHNRAPWVHTVRYEK